MVIEIGIAGEIWLRNPNLLQRQIELSEES